MTNTTIAMSDKDLERKSILDRLMNWEITQMRAAITLNLSTRQVRRLQKKYKKYWTEWLVHKLRWHASNNKKVDDPRIIDIVNNPNFHDCKPIFVTKKINDYYGIEASKETIRSIMIEQWVWHTKSRKNVKYRSLRPRRDSYWELIQFDWSYHLRFEDRNDEWCLLLAVDDATGQIMWAEFRENESYKNVSEFRRNYVKTHGIPKEIYLDKFSTYKVNNKKATYEKDLKTHFNRAMNCLWCKLIFANSPQAKGRVERCNWTLQDWLIKEMRLLKISTPEAGNKYLRDTFIPRFNKTYWVPAANNHDLHKPLKAEKKENLKRIFAKKNERSLWRDYIIQYTRRYFQIEEPQKKEYVIYPKKKLTVEETTAWELRILSWEKLVCYYELDKITVERNRAIYRHDKHRAQKKIDKARLEQRKQESNKKSKQRQNQYKAQKLIEVAKQRKNTKS